MPACVPAHVPARRGMPTAHWILLRIGVGGLFVCALAYVLWLSNTANNRDTVQALRATSANINVMDDGQYKPQVVESRLAQTSSKHKPQVVASRRAHDASSNSLEMMERAFGDKVINESLRGGIINSGGDGGGLIADSSSLARSPRDESTLRDEIESSDTKMMALEVLAETYQKLLDQLKLAEQRHGGNSTADRVLRAALLDEVVNRLLLVWWLFAFRIMFQRRCLKTNFA
jgi:hypothetical protein